jgi:hypothetical protein
LAKGDLLILDCPFGKTAQVWNSYKNGESQEEEEYIHAENTRTGLRGRVPLCAIHILACTQKPGIDELAVKNIDKNN